MAGRLIRPVRIEGDVVFVPLSRGLEAIVDICDLAIVEGTNWHATKDRHTEYASRSFLRGWPIGTEVRLHRIIMRPSLDMVVDHIDGDGLNCRRSNLRLATGSQNKRNSRKRSHLTSRLKGVCYCKSRDKWQTGIVVDGRYVNLGRFNTEEEAHAVYCEAARKHYGEFASFE